MRSEVRPMRRRQDGSARRNKKPPRRKEAKRMKWRIKKQGDIWVAEFGEHVRVWADEKEKLERWIWGKE